MRYAVLSSGSRANCTYVEAGGRSFLIDCGLSAKQTELRLRRLGIDPESLEGILITHEHGDHTRGISVMSRRYKIPVLANEATAAQLDASRLYALEHFTTGQTFEFGSCSVHPFSIVHDAVEPVAFSLHHEGLKLSHVTDLGRVTPVVRDRMKFSHALVLEFNYEPYLLQSCHYPWQVKQRIASTHGHLSNQDAAALVADNWTPDCMHLVLGHLSENSNAPEFAVQALSEAVPLESFAGVFCGSPLEESPLIQVGECRGPQGILSQRVEGV